MGSGPKYGKENKRRAFTEQGGTGQKSRCFSINIDRIERGKDCRMETKRKIILALGYKLSDKDKLFINDIKL